ncbi:MAG: hypothetical protein GX294_04445 [Candidatus Cloacimonetes bacterium]|nr:hypothetical protein [Candidatus Cloacimonadota bacterium]
MMKRNCILILALLLLLAGCIDKISRLKKEQFDILKSNVTQILGQEYKVKKINIQSEGYSESRDQYTVEFTFDLNKPHPLLPKTTNLPGRLVFAKENEGWRCIFNSGNPKDLFNLL